MCCYRNIWMVCACRVSVEKEEAKKEKDKKESKRDWKEKSAEKEAKKKEEKVHNKDKEERDPKESDMKAPMPIKKEDSERGKNNMCVLVYQPTYLVHTIISISIQW